MPWYKKYLENIWNIPNALTILRLLLIPVYVVLFAQGQMIAAMCVFIFATLTDFLDGYLARKHNQITAFGKLMDPLADKVMVITVMVTQVIAGALPLAVLMVVAGKELFLIIGGWLLVKYRDIVVFSSPIGKVAQTFFCIGLALTFLQEQLQSISFPLDMICVGIAVLLTFAALIHYIIAVAKQLKEGKNQ